MGDTIVDKDQRQQPGVADWRERARSEALPLPVLVGLSLGREPSEECFNGYYAADRKRVTRIERAVIQVLFSQQIAERGRVAPDGTYLGPGGLYRTAYALWDRAERAVRHGGLDGSQTRDDGGEVVFSWVVPGAFVPWLTRQDKPLGLLAEVSGAEAPVIDKHECTVATAIDKHDLAILRALRTKRLILEDLCQALPARHPQSRKAVSKRVHTLQDAGLVEWARRKGIALTDDGKAQIRRRRTP